MLLVLLLAAAALCARLGVWQLDRAQVHGAAAEERHTAELVAAAARPAGRRAGRRRPRSPATLVGRKVAVTGTYDAAGQLLVPGRAHDGTDRLPRPDAADGTTDGAVLPVVRGWVATPRRRRRAAGRDRRRRRLPAGVRGGRVPGCADGQTDAISSAELLNSWGGPIYTGYLVRLVVGPRAVDVVALLDPPTKPGSGLNIQNLAYAAQWWIFGAFAVLLWLRLVRDEARGARADEDAAEQAVAVSPARAAGAAQLLDRAALLLALHAAHLGPAARPGGAARRTRGSEGVVEQRVHARSSAASRLRSCDRYSWALSVSSAPRSRGRPAGPGRGPAGSGWSRRCARGRP